jgi:hypothetical protein
MQILASRCNIANLTRLFKPLKFFQCASNGKASPSFMASLRSWDKKPPGSFWNPVSPYPLISKEVRWARGRGAGMKAGNTESGPSEPSLHDEALGAAVSLGNTRG